MPKQGHQRRMRDRTPAKRPIGEYSPVDKCEKNERAGEPPSERDLTQPHRRQAEVESALRREGVCVPRALEKQRAS